MHVSGVSLDFNWFLHLILTAFVIVFGLLQLVKNTASKYFEVDANFEASGGGQTGSGDDSACSTMSGAPMDDGVCAVCGDLCSKKCARCKAVRYCSTKCQEKHWKEDHKTKCKDFRACGNINETEISNTRRGFKASNVGGKGFSAIALVPSHNVSKPLKKPKDILFPYDEFLKLFNWDKDQFAPCGLLNCGNSCFANVVLQCLSFTRPLVAFLLEKGHKSECVRDDWCFLCEFQSHVERVSRSVQPFSPNNIISRLPNIGGNLGYGRQEDAHEFMRFAIDRMQLACLDEFGGEKAVRSHSRETTIIQHIFGGRLQSQVICTNCNNISNQHENMMDLTVEIHGNAESLEECLDQFTKVEWLHGDNLYKCDGCNDYVKASKRLTVKQSPNILTIALKRFQSGRFGKLNKKVTFPETLDLSPYMSEAGDCTDVYKLYGVVVHVDMLNASFFGHYICYIKDFLGNWYRIDDCKVEKAELEEVLSQGAYMIFYSRVRPRSSSLQTTESLGNNQSQRTNVKFDTSKKEQVESATQLGLNRICSSDADSIDGSLQSDNFTSGNQPQSSRVHSGDMDEDSFEPCSSKVVSICDRRSTYGMSSEAARENVEDMNLVDIQTSSSVSEDVSSCKKDSPFWLNYTNLINNPIDMTTARANGYCHPAVSVEVSRSEMDISEAPRGDSEDVDMVDCDKNSSVAQDIDIHNNGRISGKEIEAYDNGHIGGKEIDGYGNGHIGGKEIEACSNGHGNEIVPHVDHANKTDANNQNNCLLNETSADTHKMKHGSLSPGHNFEDANGSKQME